MLGTWWSQFRNYLYDKRYLRIQRASCKVVSIGNLTWGGTGKTALAVQLGSFLLARHFRVAFLSRGYARESHGIQLVSDGREVLLSWKQAGDEAYMVAQRMRSAVVVVAEDRAAALGFLEQFEPDTILLDDGFQHRAVSRDLDLVLVDASEDLLKQRVLPFGKLREPVDALKRADAVLLTHCKRPGDALRNWIAENISAPVFHAEYAPVSSEALKGKKVAAFCAIGSPQHFFEMLREYGATIMHTRKFPDHHAYTLEELTRFEIEALNAGADILVTTRKDSVKIDPAGFRTPLLAIEAELKIQEEEGFYEFLTDKLSVSYRT